jgi:hypothetical protein
MSKWLARALAGKDGLACANSAISANSSQIEAAAGSIGTIGTIGTAPAISRDDWQAYFDERAGIREFDGDLPRCEAEVLAFEDTVGALGQRPTNHEEDAG